MYMLPEREEERTQGIRITGYYKRERPNLTSPAQRLHLLTQPLNPKSERTRELWSGGVGGGGAVRAVCGAML